MSVRLQIAALVYMMTQAVLFGIGVIAVLATPLSAHAQTLIPAVILSTAVISMPIAWKIAPRLRLRFRNRREA